jgi:glycosyltransferase involved in cell wall biosynthesis
MDPASPRTNSIADVRFCASLAAQGHPVELVVPATTASRPSNGELFASYGLEPSFAVRYLPASSSDGGSRTVIGLLRHHAAGALRRDDAGVVISRDARLLLPYALTARVRAGRSLVAPWLHEFRDKRLERLVCSRSSCILATNSAILGDVRLHGISTSRTFVTGNPVPSERVEFGRTCSRADARQRLGLDSHARVIAYTGKLYLGMRELDQILAVAARMPDCLFLFTGGQPPVIRSLNERLRDSGMTNVELAGLLAKPEESRFYQQAADVLVSYYSIEDHPYAGHNLPNKLAEYMTTGNPIVAADFPAVRDLLSSDNAVLVRPDDVDSLEEGLRFALDRPGESARLAHRAQSDVAARTAEAVGADLSGFLTEVWEAGGSR